MSGGRKIAVKEITDQIMLEASSAFLFYPAPPTREDVRSLVKAAAKAGYDAARVLPGEHLMSCYCRCLPRHEAHRGDGIDA